MSSSNVLSHKIRHQANAIVKFLRKRNSYVYEHLMRNFELTTQEYVVAVVSIGDGFALVQEDSVAGGVEGQGEPSWLRLSSVVGQHTRRQL